MVNPNEQQLISTFLEIIVGQTMETAVQCLSVTNWNLEDAINLYLHIPKQALSSQNPDHWSFQEGQQSRPPLPSKKDTLYGSSMYQTSMEVCPNIWDSTQESDIGSSSRLSSLYRLPEKHLFKGSFEDAKLTCSRRDLWLLVNLQSTTEFASHALNRDVWSNDAVSETLESSFVLFQVYDHSIEGQKISSFYKIESSPPVVLLLDPITGQKMRMWNGVIDVQRFLEDLLKYIDSGPNKYIASLTRNNSVRSEKTCSSSNHTDHVFNPWGYEFGETYEPEEETCWSSNQIDDQDMSETEEETCLSNNQTDDQDMSETEEETCLLSDMFKFLDLTEEPKGDCDRSIVCSFCVRFPDGRRKQRKFLKTEPVQLLWSFCYSHMEESEKKTFKLVHAIPGASKTLDYEANMNFEQSGLANSMISVTWE